MAIIAVDCDEVLVQTARYFVDAYNQSFSTRVDFENQHLQEATGSWQARDDDELLERLEALRDTPAYRDIAISSEDVAVLKRLAAEHELHLITARQPREEDDTRAMIERDAPGVFTDLHFVGFTGSKGAVISEIGADFLIDDSERHLRAAVQAGLSAKGALLFGDYPWNRDALLDGGMARCATWRDVERRIQDVLRD